MYLVWEKLQVRDAPALKTCHPITFSCISSPTPTCLNQLICCNDKKLNSVFSQWMCLNMRGSQTLTNLLLSTYFIYHLYPLQCTLLPQVFSSFSFDFRCPEAWSLLVYWLRFSLFCGSQFEVLHLQPLNGNVSESVMEVVLCLISKPP